MSRLKFILITSLLLSSCSLTRPYIDRQRDAGQPLENLYRGESTPANPVVCYSSWTTTLKEVTELATKECIAQETGTKAIPTKATSFDCTLLAPNRVYFICK